MVNLGSKVISWLNSGSRGTRNQESGTGGEFGKLPWSMLEGDICSSRDKLISASELDPTEL